MEQQQISAAQQVANLNAALVDAFVKREDARIAIVKYDENILAIRNALAGITIGQKLEGEVIHERAVAAAHQAKANVEDLGNVHDIKTVLHK